MVRVSSYEYIDCQVDLETLFMILFVFLHRNGTLLLSRTNGGERILDNFIVLLGSRDE